MTGLIHKAKVASTTGLAWTKLTLMGKGIKKLIAIYWDETDTSSYIALQEANSETDNDTQDTDYDVYKYTSVATPVTDTILPALPVVGSLWYYDSKSGGGNLLIIKYSVGD